MEALLMEGMPGTLALGFGIGLTGAIVPGPTLVATIDSSLRGGWMAGPRVILGHILVEAGLLVAVLAGFAPFLSRYTTGIFLVGGCALIAFGCLTLAGSRKAEMLRTNGAKYPEPVLAGILTTVSNPYFWIWWVTLGGALLLAIIPGGIVPVAGFVAGHWAADLGWYTLVSAGIHKGRFLVGLRAYRGILAVCGAFLILFGLFFLFQGWH
jgi:threonine/homoserine/homoserine lactone efflux protein